MPGVKWIMHERKLNGLIAHEAGVKAKVNEVATEIGGKARANLAAHRLTGHSRIDVEHRLPGSYGDIDAAVWLVDDNGNAVAIEYGHFHNKNRKVWVEGKYVLRNAIGG